MVDPGPGPIYQSTQHNGTCLHILHYYFDVVGTVHTKRTTTKINKRKRQNNGYKTAKKAGGVLLLLLLLLFFIFLNWYVDKLDGKSDCLFYSPCVGII